MSKRRDALELAVVCLIVILLSLAGVAGVFLTGIGLSMDGLLLILVCLMMGGLFALMLFSLAKEEGWLPTRRKREAPEAKGVKEVKETKKESPAPAVGSPTVEKQEGGK